MKHFKIFITLFSLLFLGYVAALLCYSCYSYIDPQCSVAGTELSSKSYLLIVNCTGSCHKKSKYSRKQVYVERTCEPTIQPDGCTDKGETICYCSNDLCNNAKILNINIFHLTFGVLLSIFLKC